MKKLIALVLCVALAVSMVCVASADAALDRIQAAGQLIVETEAT